MIKTKHLRIALNSFKFWVCFSLIFMPAFPIEQEKGGHIFTRVFGISARFSWWFHVGVWISFNTGNKKRIRYWLFVWEGLSVFLNTPISNELTFSRRCWRWFTIAWPFYPGVINEQTLWLCESVNSWHTGSNNHARIRKLIEL